MRRAAVVALALAVAACTTGGPSEPIGPTPPPMREPPPPPPPPPSGTIIGHGDFKTHTGAHGACAGLSIALMHETPDFRQRIIALYGSADSARLLASTVKARAAKLGPAPQPPLAASVTCDAASNFAFRDVSPGAYFIIARVRQTATSGATQDIVVMRQLSVIQGQTEDVSLAP